MGKRLTRIYTRTGDDGTTGLGDGGRTGKESLRIEAIGTVDELNSHIGVLLSGRLQEDMRSRMENVQHDLFDLGGDLSIPGRVSMNEAQVSRLEKELDEYNASLAPLKEFILPGGTPLAATCHVARSVCRRAERCVMRLYRAETAVPCHIHYLNRLSDLLFVLCRVLNREHGVDDVMWQPGKTRSIEAA
ncbi:cob(I)yrinic acid a,c-diamide adenosyltransferase [Nitrosospira sp. Is2]|uniref:cob(I)yrinic acid a,c-diamide adenosyltransferase n=1 Tax=Nitrosospira sp. Is2 TaxID=3080532 RepID=UPI002953FE85|nr:cob(I)yrinic acid a,c-diamide adenosyltransferase [Nitrosospira sp. Is2]WON75160.1 cob(I)yrinic acid a,c-diamide adenosyltransferase [Nitrosospira sp. Is2]